MILSVLFSCSDSDHCQNHCEIKRDSDPLVCVCVGGYVGGWKEEGNERKEKGRQKRETKMKNKEGEKNEKRKKKKKEKKCRKKSKAWPGLNASWWFVCTDRCECG